MALEFVSTLRTINPQLPAHSSAALFLIRAGKNRNAPLRMDQLAEILQPLPTSTCYQAVEQLVQVGVVDCRGNLSGSTALRLTDKAHCLVDYLLGMMNTTPETRRRGL
jgi:hypothetical protein